MLIQFADFNQAGKIIATQFSEQWEQLRGVLEGMRLHLKASDQAGIQGTPIFDPVGTNEYIKRELRKIEGWQCNISIPAEFDFLGTDVDFGNAGVLVEIQFSNYPFLLNNTVRSELFYKSKTPLTGQPVEVAIIVTKAKMFPASNSTLYYEQGKRQLISLARNNVFDCPMRLVGLFEEEDTTVPIDFTVYSSSRYSRTVKSREQKQCRIGPGRGQRSRSILTVID